MKYLVMETYNSYAVLLDESGRFVKTANPGYEIGETIKNPVIMRSEPLEKVKKPRKFVRLVTTIAAIFALVIGINVYRNNYMADASIYIAINPRIQMDLNKKGKVLDVKGTNLDGQNLVAAYDQTSSDKSKVTDDLIDLAIEMGFLSEGGSVSIGIDTTSRESFKEYGIELRQTLKKREAIEIEITEHGKTDQNKEKESEREEGKLELSPNKEKERETNKEKEVKVEKKKESKKIESEKEKKADDRKEKVIKENRKEEKSAEKARYITMNQAKAIAFRHAGVSESELELEQVELKEDDASPYYEIEFDKDEDEYDYEIHAISGKIIDYEHDLATDKDDSDEDDEEDEDD